MSKKVKSRPVLESESKEEKVEEKESKTKEEKVKAEKKTKAKESPKKEEEPKTKKTRKRKKAVDIEPNELIPVRSVTKGLLIYKSSRTGQVVRWNEFGAVEFIEFGELVTMKSSSPRFMDEPYLVIDDEEVVEKLGLKDLYSKMIDIDNIEKFFTSSLDDMRSKLERMPKGNKRLIGDTAHEMVKSGELYDIRKIRLLEEELGIGLQIAMD